MKKRVISILCIIILAIAVVFFIEMKFSNRTEQQTQNKENNINTAADNTDHSAEKQSKQLNDKYFANLNEEISLKTTFKDDNEEYTLKVTDAVLTKDVSEYSSMFDSPYYYTKTLEQYVNDAGIYGDGAYYMVFTVEISNNNDGIRDILVPGDFWMQYFSDNTEEGNNLKREYDEMARGVSISGNIISSNGHVKLNKGESCTVVLVSSITNEKLEKLKQEGKKMYLTMGSTSIQYIPNDDNRVRFVNIDFRYEG